VAGVVWVTLTNAGCINMMQAARAEYMEDEPPEDPLSY
jgi:hypothetical protein